MIRPRVPETPVAATAPPHVRSGPIVNEMSLGGRNMFVRSARYYDALYRFKDYHGAAERLALLVSERHPDARSLLDVGCGTGRHLEWLQDRYYVEGLDISAELLQIARSRCPRVPFHEGDMTTFSLGRTFDVVTCLFSAIAYVRTVPRLRATVARLAEHVAPGGLVVIEPWFTPDTFWDGHVSANFVDEPDLKIAWMYVNRRRAGVSVLEIEHLVATAAGVEHFTEVHELGLFSHSDYLGALDDAGLRPWHEPIGLFERGLYIGHAP